MISLKRWQFLWIQVWRLFLKIASTRFRNFKSISSIFWQIAIFKSSRVYGFPSYTRNLKYPQRKKWHFDWFGERGDQWILPNHEMTRFGSRARIASIEALAKCAVIPSCWNHTLCLVIRIFLSSGSGKLLIMFM